MGIDADPRGKKGVERHLARQKKILSELPKNKKQDFDRENLTNPYADSRILIGDKKAQVKKVMAGIDFETGEVVLAGRLNIKYMGWHTVWDNMGWYFMKNKFEAREFDPVGDVMDELRKVPEYAQAIKFKAGPSLFVGSEKNRAGKVVVKIG